MRYFYGFMQGIVSGAYPFLNAPYPIKSIVAVQFKDGAVPCLCLRAIYLYLIVFLCSNTV